MLVPLLLCNKASGYTTSLVILQGMRTKVSLWNPRLALSWSIRFSVWETAPMSSSREKDLSLLMLFWGRFWTNHLTWTWELLSLAIFIGFWDYFRSLSERKRRTVLERSQVSRHIRLCNPRSGKHGGGTVDSHTTWARAVRRVWSSHRLVTINTGSREGTVNWERMMMAC